MKTFIFFLPLILITLIVSGCEIKKKKNDEELIARLVTLSSSQAFSGNQNTDSGSNFRVGGAIAGLNGVFFVQNNNTERFPFNVNGNFFLPITYPDGSSYFLSIFQQPTGQTCNLNNHFGAISGADVTNVQIICLNN